jgi:hypothetical protein
LIQLKAYFSETNKDKKIKNPRLLKSFKTTPGQKHKKQKNATRQCGMTIMTKYGQTNKTVFLS